MYIYSSILYIFLKNVKTLYSWVQYETCFGVPDFENQP